MKNQPNKIYLNTGIEGSDKGIDFKKLFYELIAEKPRSFRSGMKG